jgi:hypothetical protein
MTSSPTKRLKKIARRARADQVTDSLMRNGAPERNLWCPIFRFWPQIMRAPIMMMSHAAAKINRIGSAMTKRNKRIIARKK